MTHALRPEKLDWHGPTFADEYFEVFGESLDEEVMASVRKTEDYLIELGHLAARDRIADDRGVSSKS